MSEYVPGPSRAAWVRGALLLLALGGALSGCAMHWPWRHRAPPAPQPVQELGIQAPAGLSLAQYWDRNALLVDLSAAEGAGEVVLTPSAADGWPVRLEFRVQPGHIGVLELLGAERVVFNVPASGATLVLRPGPEAYRHDTAQITVRWRAADDSAH